MKPHLQTTLLAFFILPILSSFLVVNADTSKTTNSEIRYQRYSWREGRKYHRFLPSRAPEGLSYNTRLKATANIDDTPERESVVLMLLDVPTIEYYPFAGKWVQAFLLIADETETGVLKKKAFFKLFDSGTHALEVPTAKSIELQSPAFVFTELPKDALKSRAAAFRLVDLTGDGTLDIWVEFGDAVAVISFQNGEFRKIFGSYGYHGDQAKTYIDLDNDGIYEIKIPNSVYPRGPKTEHPTWINLYEWNGNMYVLNNAKFYTRDNDILIQLMLHYNTWLKRERDASKWTPQRIELIKSGKFAFYAETCQFYIGLAHYYGGEAERAQAYLQRVAEQGKHKHYIQAAEAILKKLPRQRR